MPSKKSNPKPKPKSLPQPVHEWSFEAIGTQWWIGLYEPCDAKKLSRVQRAVENRIEVFDKTYSRFRPGSLVTEISKNAGNYIFPTDADTLFALYRLLYDLTDGAVTPLVGKLLSDAGYDDAYSLKPGELRRVPEWDEAMEYRDGVLTTYQPVLLDFGAAGKGYLVDLIAIVLQKNGISGYCVDAGGDMVCRGLSAPLAIGLENPADTTQAVGVAELQDGALCGSAGNRRKWAGLTHIMDPRLRTSPRHLAAVWVQAESCMLADGLATALYFADTAKLHEQFVFEHCIMYADGRVVVSNGFPAQLFTNKQR